MAVVPIGAITEVSFEPTDLIDLTIHFKDHAFHTHSQILSHASSYFAAAIKAARSEQTSECATTSICGQAGQRCLSLPDMLGGKEFSAAELNTFIDLMYNPNLLITLAPPRKMSLEHATAYFRSTGISATFSIDRDKLTVTSSEDDQVEEVLQTDEDSLTKLVEDVNVDEACVSGSYALKKFIDTHTRNVQLATYFDCKNLMSGLEGFCSNLTEDAILMNYYDDLWRLLPLAEECQWKFVPKMLDALASDKHASSRDTWESTMDSFTDGRCRIATLTKLYRLTVIERSDD